MSEPSPPAAADLVRRFNVPTPRYTSYPTVPEWSSSFGSAEHVRALERADRAPCSAPLSLYVHVPFCRELCLYCGCNVIVARSPAIADRYLAYLRRELALVAAHLARRRLVSRVHLGGGTPTFLSEEQLGTLWSSIGEQFDVRGDAELAIEVDPAVTTRAQLSLLASLGFRRLSMGVQDFDPRVQEAVRRKQSVGATRELVEHARAVGFESINLDLIYGLPYQSSDSWQRTLEQVIPLAPDRLAVFSLAFVPAIRPHQRKLPEEALPTGEAKLELARIAHRALTGAGYRAIGMDHYALPGDELAGAQEARRLWRDFQGYTVRRAADTVAIGVTGISDLGGAYAQSVRSLTRYQAAIDGGALATERGLQLSPDDQRRRATIIQIMCNFWIDLGGDGATYFERELAELRSLQEDGLVQIDGAQMTITELGRPFVRNVAAIFDRYLRRAGNRTFSKAV